MKKYKRFTKKELVNILAKEKVTSIKKEMKSKGKQWDYGDGLQTSNTIERNWKKLYSTYPIVSKANPMFSLSKLYDEMIEHK